MADKNLYVNDLNHRYASHTFTETTTGDMTNVVFKEDSSSDTIGEATNNMVIDAYRAIRLDLLGGEVPAFICTTTERDALSSIDKGTQIFNITTARNESYSGTAWNSSAGTSVMGDTAYGHMYENNSTGSAIDATNKTWITATEGVVDSNGLVTFVNDSTGDYFLIGTEGDGDYIIHVDTKQTNSGNNTTTLTVQVDGVDTIIVRDEVDTSSTKPTALDANGILALTATNKVRLHMESSTPANTVTVYYTHFYIHRIS